MRRDMDFVRSVLIVLDPWEHNLGPHQDSRARSWSDPLACHHCFCDKNGVSDKKPDTQ